MRDVVSRSSCPIFPCLRYIYPRELVFYFFFVSFIVNRQARGHGQGRLVLWILFGWGPDFCTSEGLGLRSWAFSFGRARTENTSVFLLFLAGLRIYFVDQILAHAPLSMITAHSIFCLATLSGIRTVFFSLLFGLFGTAHRR